MKYCLVPFGCQMNISDSERIRSILESLGYERTEVEEEADILGIVACSVRQKAIDKVYTRIHKWNTWKAERPLVTFVSGCVLPADREKFVDRFDLIFTITELPQLPEMLRQHGVVTPASIRAAEAAANAALGSAVASEIDAAEIDRTPAPGAAIETPGLPLARVAGARAARERRKEYWRITPRYSSSFEAYVPIQNGCDKFCTFCAVPYTRGREVSRPSGEILDEVRRLALCGYKSITLLGQNVNSYGLDRDGDEVSFARLLEEIGEIGEEFDARAGDEGPPPFWLYFTSPHPRDMTDEVIDVIARYDCLAKQIHLPIQSGDDKLLLRMRRNHTVERYRHTVSKIRSTIPQATLFTDIIVGFSGETEEQFENTRAVMREFEYNMAYIAMYSPRPGAASARWDDTVPHEEKKRRLHELSGELQRISLAQNQALVGSEMTVLVDGADRKPGYLTGKTEGKLIVRFAAEDRSLIGRFVRVRVDSAAALSVEGSLSDVADAARVPAGATADR